MAQFSVHLNGNPHTAADIPYLLDVQTDLLADLSTRVVVPLYRAEVMAGKVVRRLMPTFIIDGQPLVMVTPQLAGVANKLLGPPVADLSDQRDLIIAALDLLVTGI